MPLNDAQRELVEAHMTMAQKLASIYIRRLPPHADRDGIKASAYLGLCEAAIRFNPALGDFGGYAQRRVYGAMNDFARSQTTLTPHRTHYRHPKQEIMPSLPNDDDPTRDIEQRDQVDSLLRGLPRCGKLVLKMIADGCEWVDIASALGASVNLAFRIRRKSFAMIRARE